MSTAIQREVISKKPKKTQRRAPSGGYSYPAKAAFRRWVWDRIGGTIQATGEVYTGNVLLMPSIEGCEITDEALPRGFNVGQLHVADKNPAIVATLQRRFPGINTYGCLVDKACHRISNKKIKLIAANIDFCCQLTMETLRAIRAISNSQSCESAHLFITILRGREDKFFRSIVGNGSGNSGFDSYLSRLMETAFLENKDGAFWDTTNGINPTSADFWRIRAIHKMTERQWAQGRAYVSVNNQSFLTVWLCPKDHPLPDLDESRTRQLENLRALAHDGDPGDPLPPKDADENDREYRSRLTTRQRLRLHLVSQSLEIPEATVISRYAGRSNSER